MSRIDLDDNQWMPLYLSSIAGASTCIGAGIVFLLPRTNSSSESSRNKRVVPPGMMSFSLSLAGSVMVTVSVISILPECLVENEGGGFVSRDKLFFRALFFALGWGLYLGLSKILSVPDPEDLLASAVLPLSCGEGENTKILNANELTAEASNEDYEHSGPINNETSEFLPATKSNNENGSEEDKNKSLVISPSRRNDDGVRSRKATFNSSATKKGNNVDNTNLTWVMSSISSSGSTKISEWTSGKDLETKDQRNAWRVAVLLFFSLLFHNFPEGLAVAASALESEKLGITVTIGIMIHNIPEGIAIAIPCLAARPDQPWLSFFMASVSGLAEPLGAFVALMFLRFGAPISSTSLIWNLENVLAFVAGIMIAVAVCELFPEAKEHVKQNNYKFFWIGAISGVIVMVVTEWYT